MKCVRLVLQWIATLVGTMLHGKRADQLWGRFWCCYPKQNGALHIVIWSAILLHARWGGMISQVIIIALGLIRESAVWAGDDSFTAKPDEA